MAIRVLGFIVLSLIVLGFSGGVAIGQNPSPAFWELRPERVDAMLLPFADGLTLAVKW